MPDRQFDHYPGTPPGTITSLTYGNVKLEDHEKEPEPAPPALDGPTTYDASAPGNLEPERLVKFIKDGLGPRHADALSVDVVNLRRVVLVLAEHVAHIGMELQKQSTRKAKQ